MYAIRHIPTQLWLIDNPEGVIPLFPEQGDAEIIAENYKPEADYKVVEVEIVEVKK
jgi:hypothetical protein